MLITTYIQLKEDKTEIRKQSKTPRPCTFLVVSHFQHGESSWCGGPSLNYCHTFYLLHLQHQDCPMLENPQGNLTASAILLSSFYSLTFLIKWLYPLNVSETQVSSSPLSISNTQDWWILSSMGTGLRVMEQCFFIYFHILQFVTTVVNFGAHLKRWFSLSFMWVKGLNTCRRAFQQAPWLSEPSCRPQGALLFTHFSNHGSKWVIKVDGDRLSFFSAGDRTQTLVHAEQKCSAMELHSQPSSATTIFLK